MAQQISLPWPELTKVQSKQASKDKVSVKGSPYASANSPANPDADDPTLTRCRHFWGITTVTRLCVNVCFHSPVLGREGRCHE